MSNQNEFKDFDSYVRKIIGVSAAIAVVGALIAALTTYRRDPTIFSGVCLGAVFSLLRWRLIIRELRKFGAGVSGTGHWLRGFFVRYGLTGAVIAISLASDAFSPASAIPAVFLVNAVILAEQAILILKTRFKGQENWE